MYPAQRMMSHRHAQHVDEYQDRQTPEHNLLSPVMGKPKDCQPQSDIYQQCQQLGRKPVMYKWILLDLDCQPDTADQQYRIVDMWNDLDPSLAHKRRIHKQAQPTNHKQADGDSDRGEVN